MIVERSTASVRDDAAHDKELLAQISAICHRAAAGDLEARISSVPPEGDWRGVCQAINSLLDMVDCWVRESQAVLECCGRGEFHRPVLVRGLHGAYRGAAVVMNRAALEMQQNAARLAEAEEATRGKLIQEISLSARTIAESCQQLNTSSNDISLKLAESSGLADTAVSQSRTARQAAGSLSENAARIRDVVRLINEIASQTNLLALNAAIEAARAGEHGKGFAVVANEVKELSRSTAAATGTIARQVESIAAAATHCESAISQIGDSIGNVNGNVAAIAGCVEEQVRTTKEISIRMNAVSASFDAVMSGRGRAV